MTTKDKVEERDLGLKFVQDSYMGLRLNCNGLYTPEEIDRKVEQLRRFLYSENKTYDNKR
jgi:hypothetical protein